MTIVEITGGMLRAARSLAGLSQQELAERASISRPCLTAGLSPLWAAVPSVQADGVQSSHCARAGLRRHVVCARKESLGVCRGKDLRKSPVLTGRHDPIPRHKSRKGAGSRPGQLAIGSARAAAHATAGTGKAAHSLLLPFDADDDAPPGSLHTVGVALLAAGV